jgi:hypothetical protein
MFSPGLKKLIRLRRATAGLGRIQCDGVGDSRGSAKIRTGLK